MWSSISFRFWPPLWLLVHLKIPDIHKVVHEKEDLNEKEKNMSETVEYVDDQGSFWLRSTFNPGNSSDVEQMLRLLSEEEMNAHVESHGPDNVTVVYRPDDLSRCGLWVSSTESVRWSLDRAIADTRGSVYFTKGAGHVTGNEHQKGCNFNEDNKENDE